MCTILEMLNQTIMDGLHNFLDVDDCTFLYFDVRCNNGEPYGMDGSLHSCLHVLLLILGLITWTPRKEDLDDRDPVYISYI